MCGNGAKDRVQKNRFKSDDRKFKIIRAVNKPTHK